ncbi:Uncharacterised protein [Vibrio cholerae]|nr:Uncharacterised protein [Vibrio cholerae]
MASAPQFTATKGPFLRWLFLCSALTNSFLPTPVWPRISKRISLSITRLACCQQRSTSASPKCRSLAGVNARVRCCLEWSGVVV